MGDQGSNQHATKVHVGEVVYVPEGVTITRPDGTDVTVVGWAYVADVAGEHHVRGDQPHTIQAG